jgi:hypothetical protein
MVWFASDLHQKLNLLEHKFACDHCDEIEHINVPFTPSEAA